MNTELPEELARRAEICSAWRGVRYAEAYTRLHPQSPAEVLEVGGGWATYINPDSPLNSARGLGLAGPPRPADMDALEDFFRARGASVRLHVCPLADRALWELARERGYVLRTFFSVLVRGIPGGFQPQPLPPRVRIRPARPEEAQPWLDASAQGFEETAQPSQEIYDILGPNFHAEDAVPFAAWVEDSDGAARLAGTGGMYFDPRTRALELGGASTIPAFRRMGVQRALIEARLAEGLRRGCDLAIVLTTPGSHSERNLARAGFQLAYTKVVVEKMWE